MLARRGGPLGVWFHRVVRAVRSFGRNLRLGTASGAHRTGDRHLSGQRPPNPWPRCVACHRHVARLCEQCGVCPACCDPDNHTDPERAAT